MNISRTYAALPCAVMTLLLTACSAAGRQRITPDELDPALNQEIDPNKEVLIYARTSPNNGQWFDREAVDRFNRSHDDIQILVKDYYGSAEDRARGYERLRSEMAAGQVPDIIDLAGVSYLQAIQKGYLENLWPYIKNDPDLSRDGVLEAPLEAAWEFMGTVYMEPKDGSQDNNYAIPVWKALYDKQKDDLMSMEQKIAPFVFTMQQAITVPPLTAEEVRQFEDFFNSIDKIELTGERALFELVLEVCGPYFAGDKTLDETAALVQNRVGLYISEQK